MAEGLDYHVVGGSGFFAQQEVLDLINVLTAVEDPLDGVSLAGRLAEPVLLDQRRRPLLARDRAARAALTRA